MDLFIETLIPDATTTPIEGEDVRGSYVGWELDSEYNATVRIPIGYLAGEDLYLTFDEATAGESLKHKWSIEITLNATATETFVSEVTSSGVASTLTNRSITISTDGEIDGTPIAPDDVLHIEWSRVAASADEDSNNILVYAAVLRVTTAAEATSDCLGRLGTIIDRVGFALNEALASTDFYEAADVVDLCNQCTLWMIENGYRWKTTFDLSLVADQQSYDLADISTLTFEELQWLQWIDTKQRIRQVSTRQELEQAIEILPSGERPYLYSLDGSTIHFAPVPSVNDSGAVRVFHTYLPTDLECLTAYTPDIPAAHDLVYVNYCVEHLYLRERGALASNANMAAEWGKRTRMSFSRLLGASRGRLVLRGSRS